MQHNLNPPTPIKGLSGEWINTENYVNNGIFVCHECDIIWSLDNATFYNKEKCPKNKCNKLCRSKYIWYSNTNLSNDIITKCSIKLIPSNQNNGIWIKSSEYKSFGSFECFECSNIKCKKNKKFKEWISAYANSKYTQQCTQCKNAYFPKFMWINHTYKEQDDKEDNKEHLSHLCGACRCNDCPYIKKNILETDIKKNILETDIKKNILETDIKKNILETNIKKNILETDIKKNILETDINKNILETDIKKNHFFY
jgi:hypothetical protein